MPERDEIGDLAAAYGQAVLDKDVAQLAALYDPNVKVFDTWRPRPLKSLAAWRANLDEWLGSLSDHEKVQVTFDDVQICSGGAMGCLHALVTYSALNREGKILRSMQNRLSWVVTKSSEGWSILHEHTSVPIGPDLKATL